MISQAKIFLFATATISLILMFCKANVLISSETSAEEKYRADWMVFQHVDRFHSYYRRTEAWETYEEMNEFVNSDFDFFITDDNVKELRHYMNFIATSGVLLNNNLTVSYSILYTKYTAMFYAINLLNIYKIKRKEFESWDTDTSVNAILKKHKELLLNVYLKIGQYLAWYAHIGNDFLQKIIDDALLKKAAALCAVEEYTKFKDSFNRFYNKINETIFKTMKSYIDNEKSPDIDLNDTWKNIYNESAEDIQTINRYFTAIFFGNPQNKITEKDFLETAQKESFIAKFVSDLSVIKGRDIEETYANFDNDNKKESYEANVINVMMVIERNEIKSIQKDFDEQTVLNQKSGQYVLLQPSPLEEVYTCLRSEVKQPKKLLLPKEDDPATSSA